MNRWPKNSKVLPRGCYWLERCKRCIGIFTIQRFAIDAANAPCPRPNKYIRRIIKRLASNHILARRCIIPIHHIGSNIIVAYLPGSCITRLQLAKCCKANHSEQ